MSALPLPPHPCHVNTATALPSTLPQQAHTSGDDEDECHHHYQQLFTAVLLQEQQHQQEHTLTAVPRQQHTGGSGSGCAAGPSAPTATPTPAAAQQLRAVLADELLQAGADTRRLQGVLAGCAAAVLKVSRALQQGHDQPQLLQEGLAAMEEVAGLLQHCARDEQLLQLSVCCLSSSSRGSSRGSSRSQHVPGTPQQSAEAEAWRWLASCQAAAEMAAAACGMLAVD